MLHEFGGLGQETEFGHLNILCDIFCRCIKMTDDGFQEVLQKCCSLESLNLYALSR